MKDNELNTIATKKEAKKILKDYYIDEINEKQTIKNAKAILKQYRKLKSIVPSMDSVTTQRLTHEPKSKTNNKFSVVEKNVEHREKIFSQVKATEDAVKSIVDKQLQKILLLKFLEFNTYRNYNISDALLMSETQFYRRLNVALLYFAYHYKQGELLAFD